MDKSNMLSLTPTHAPFYMKTSWVAKILSEFLASMIFLRAAKCACITMVVQGLQQ